MTTIYVDSSVAALPDAPGRLVPPTDAGHAVVLVAEPDHLTARDLSAAVLEILARDAMN